MRHEVPRVSVHEMTMTRAGGLVVGLLGVLACSPVLGIGEASLRCDTDPCTTGVSSPAGSAAGSARRLDAGTARGGAGGVNRVETPAPVTSRTESEVSGGGVAPTRVAPAAEDSPGPGGAASSGAAPAPEDSGAPEGSGGPGGSRARARRLGRGRRHRWARRRRSLLLQRQRQSVETVSAISVRSKSTAAPRRRAASRSWPALASTVVWASLASVARSTRSPARRAGESMARAWMRRWRRRGRAYRRWPTRAPVPLRTLRSNWPTAPARAAAPASIDGQRFAVRGATRRVRPR